MELAELETGGEMAIGVVEEVDTETVLLRQSQGVDRYKLEDQFCLFTILTFSREVLERFMISSQLVL